MITAQTEFNTGLTNASSAAEYNKIVATLKAIDSSVSTQAQYLTLIQNIYNQSLIVLGNKIKVLVPSLVYSYSDNTAIKSFFQDILNVNTYVSAKTGITCFSGLSDTSGLNTLFTQIRRVRNDFFPHLNWQSVMPSQPFTASSATDPNISSQVGAFGAYTLFHAYSIGQSPFGISQKGCLNFVQKISPYYSQGRGLSMIILLGVRLNNFLEQAGFTTASSLFARYKLFDGTTEKQNQQILKD
jgi:hypothetical protein